MELRTITINEMINELTMMARTYKNEQIAAIGVDANGNFVFFKNGEAGTIEPMFKTKPKELKDEKDNTVKCNSLTENEYEELHCTYCDSQRCLNRNGNTLAEKCPYWKIRMGKGE